LVEGKGWWESTNRRIYIPGHFIKDLDLSGFGSPRLQLYPYQVDGVKYGLDKRRCLIAFAMGLGKTASSLGIAHVLQPWPILIMAPSIAKYNWARHILGFPQIDRDPWLPYIAPEEIGILEGLTPTDLPSLKIVIINYDILSPTFTTTGWGNKKKKMPGWQDVLSDYGFKMVIIDESHYLKSPKANRTLATKAITKGIPTVIGLTGTPFPNKVKEIMPQLDILRRLDDFGGYHTFSKNFCAGHWQNIGHKKIWFIDGSSNLAVLNDQLRSICMIRREKHEVLTDLPSLTRNPILMQLDNQSEYDRAERDLAKWIGEKKAEDVAFLASISYLPILKQKQLKLQYAHSAEQKARGREQLLKFIYLKKLSAEGKMKQVIEWSQEFIDSGEKLVLFAWHQSIQKALWEGLQNNKYVVTRISAENRDEIQAAQDAFQLDEGVKIIVCSIPMASEAIDLYAASNLLSTEWSFSPGKQEQYESRVHRNGQVNPVVSHYAMGIGTIDEITIDKLDLKAIVTTMATSGIDLVGGEENIINHLVGHLYQKYKEKL